MISALNMATAALQGVEDFENDDDQVLDFMANVVENIRKRWKKKTV